MLMLFGCAASSNTSTIMDPASFPPGRYGLYESKSGQLVLTYDLKADETFGFEYVEHAGSRNARPSALKISRHDDRLDGGMSVIWRVPLKPTEYEWRPLATPVASVPAAAVLAP
jgi:hypothetical protein